MPVRAPSKVNSAKNAYQRYLETRYGPDVTSHKDSSGNYLDSFASAFNASYGNTTARTSKAASAVSGAVPAGRSYEGPGAGLSAPSYEGSTAAHEALFNAISEAEGTTKHGYDTMYGGGQRDFSNMSLRDVLNLQSNMIANTGHSPTGRFQITRDTLQEHAKKLGLDLDKTKYDKTTQNKLALSIAGTQGVKPTVWAGFQSHPEAFARAKQAYAQIAKTPASTAYSAPAGNTPGASGGIQYSIRDRTSAQGLVPGLQSSLAAAQQAARDAGLDHISVVAGKGQGHLSHAQGSEADIIGYNADGSQWSNAQRVAVAKGAAGAGANRFGFYSGPTLHMGVGAPGLPKNVVWNDQVRGHPGVTTFHPEERDFVNSLRNGQLASSTRDNSGYDSSQVASLQRDLNARGANIPVDGIMGPKTRAAQQQYSPNTSTNTTYASDQQDDGTVRAGVKTPTQVADLGATRGITIGQKPLSPYTTSTGGAKALGTAYNAYEAQRNAARLGPTVTPRQVQTQAVDATGYPPVQMQGAFNRPAVPQTPAFMNPYAGTTGGANAIVQPTARIPQPRPPGLQWSQLQQSAPAVQEQAVPAPVANWTLADIQRWADQHGIPVTKAAGVLSDIGSRAGNAFSEGSRSGMGYSGGNYSGGTYGGAGGRSISSGVGGAFKNR